MAFWFPKRRGDHSSGINVTIDLNATHPNNWPENRLTDCSATLFLFGFAPDGVYRAAAITGMRGGLLPHHFTLTPDACTPGAVCFLLHFPLGWRASPFPQPEVIRHRVSMEPGLSSVTAFQPCDSNHPTDWLGDIRPKGRQGQPGDENRKHPA